MNPIIMSTPGVKRGDYSVVPYQSPHNTGGTMTGTDPKSSVVNRYLQAWDADNVFVMGASYNPTRVGGAPAYWSAHAITTQYLKNPGRWCRHEADLRGDLNDPQGQSRQSDAVSQVHDEKDLILPQERFERLIFAASPRCVSFFSRRGVLAIAGICRGRTQRT